MRARRGATSSEFRLFAGEREIGYINDTTVGFLGFASRTEAALAASVAHRGLARRRGRQVRPANVPDDFLVMEHGSTQHVIATAGVLATLRPPGSDATPVAGWGFEIELLPEERLGVFAVGRARVMWRALRATGIYRRMRQFNTESLASVGATFHGFPTSDQRGEKYGWVNRLLTYFGSGPHRRPAGEAEGRAPAGAAPALTGS